MSNPSSFCLDVGVAELFGRTDNGQSSQNTQPTVEDDDEDILSYTDGTLLENVDTESRNAQIHIKSFTIYCLLMFLQ